MVIAYTNTTSLVGICAGLDLNRIEWCATGLTECNVLLDTARLDTALLGSLTRIAWLRQFRSSHWLLLQRGWNERKWRRG